MELSGEVKSSWLSPQNFSSRGSSNYYQARSTTTTVFQESLALAQAHTTVFRRIRLGPNRGIPRRNDAEAMWDALWSSPQVCSHWHCASGREPAAKEGQLPISAALHQSALHEALPRLSLICLSNLLGLGRLTIQSVLI